MRCQPTSTGIRSALTGHSLLALLPRRNFPKAAIAEIAQHRLASDASYADSSTVDLERLSAIERERYATPMEPRRTCLETPC